MLHCNERFGSYLFRTAKMASRKEKQSTRKRKSPLGIEESVAKRLTVAAPSSSASDPCLGTRASSNHRSLNVKSDVTWQDLYNRNGAADWIPKMDELLKKCDVDVDPPLVFDWHHTRRLLNAMRIYDGTAGALPRPPFLLPVNVLLPDADDLVHTAILQYVSRTAGLALQDRHGTAGFGCDGVQSMQISGECATLRTEPYFSALALHTPAAFPIATIYTPRPRTHRLRIVSLAPGAANHTPLWA